MQPQQKSHSRTSSYSSMTALLKLEHAAPVLCRNTTAQRALISVGGASTLGFGKKEAFTKSHLSSTRNMEKEDKQGCRERVPSPQLPQVEPEGPSPFLAALESLGTARYPIDLNTCRESPQQLACL